MYKRSKIQDAGTIPSSDLAQVILDVVSVTLISADPVSKF